MSSWIGRIQLFVKWKGRIQLFVKWKGRLQLFVKWKGRLQLFVKWKPAKSIKLLNKKLQLEVYKDKLSHVTIIKGWRGKI